MNNTSTSQVRVIVSSLVILLVVVLVYLWTLSLQTTSSAGQLAAAQPAEDSHVQVVQADSQSQAQVVPAGFPSEIPVDATHIVESYKAVYKDHNVTQYTVSFVSGEPQATLWKEYASAFAAAGFTLDTAMSSKTAGQMVGAKGSDALTISFSPQGQALLVRINVLEQASA